MSTDLDPAIADSRRQRPKRPRAGRGWWALAAASVVVGSVLGVTATYLARPTPPHATSSQIITSTGGTFTKGSGHAAPAWALPELRNPKATVSLAQFKGHPLVVNFWASWCPPCRKEMPALAAAARRLAGRVDFVGVDTNDQRGAALAFAAKTGVGYPLAFDRYASAANNYAVYGLPTTFFLSPQGNVLGLQTGGMTAARLAQLVKQTFGISESNSR